MYAKINTSRTASLTGLRYEYREWLYANDLPKMSAENLLQEEHLTSEQRVYLKSFIVRWVSTPVNQEAGIEGLARPGRCQSLIPD